MGRDREGLARLHRPGFLPVDLVLQLSLEHVDDLLAEVEMPGRWRLRAELEAILDHLASGDAEVLLLEVDTVDSGHLLRGIHRSTPEEVDEKPIDACGLVVMDPVRRVG